MHSTSWLALLAGLLLCASLADARGFSNAIDNTQAHLEGPRRRLLATSTVSGRIFWADNSESIAGATVKAYDNDVSGSEFMAETISKADGTYTITYTAKNWDSCCFGATKPDIILKVYVGGKFFYQSAEVANVGSSLSGKNMAIPRYLVSGKLEWQEICGPAVNAKATVWDSDIDSDDLMGSTLTKADGTYLAIVPKKDNGDTWDILGGDPDPYVEFTGPYGIAGKTSEKTNTNAVALNYGTSLLWRNDPSAAKTIAAQINGDKQDYVTVTEYNHCTPKKMVVTVKLKIGKALLSPPSDSMMPRLKQLVKDGIKENWSRTGIRAITVGSTKYDVHVQVIESSSGYSTSLKWAKDVEKDCERSNNPGIPVLGLDLTLWYNEGCAKFADPVGWQAIADRLFKDTAGHEWGHTVLQKAVSMNYSWTHKGSTTLLQEPSGSATNYPATGDIDIMLYYKNGAPPQDRTWAVEQDVKRLVGISKTSYVKLCGTCPAP